MRSTVEALSGSSAVPEQAVGYEAVNGAVSLYDPVVDVRDQMQIQVAAKTHIVSAEASS